MCVCECNSCPAETKQCTHTPAPAFPNGSEDGEGRNKANKSKVQAPFFAELPLSRNHFPSARSALGPPLLALCHEAVHQPLSRKRVPPAPIFVEHDKKGDKRHKMAHLADRWVMSETKGAWDSLKKQKCDRKMAMLRYVKLSIFMFLRLMGR